MNERALRILSLLIRRPEYRMTDLENMLHLTKRQINYSISQINETLEEKLLPKIQRNKAGDFFVPMEVVQAAALSSEENLEENDFLTDSERMELLLLYLMISSENISLFHIMDLLNISKNTALSDTKNANRYAERYSLAVRYTRTSGYIVSGSERQVRMLLNDLIQKRMKLAKKNHELQEYLTVRKDETIHLIRSVEKKLDIKYADESFDFMIEAIGYTLTRIQSGKVSETAFFSKQVADTREYKVMNKLLPETWQLSNDDIEWITLIFLSSNTYQNKLNEKDSDQKLRKFVREMVNQFQIQTFIDIEDRLNFEKRLFDHLRPACFRIQYGLKIGNIGLDAVISDNGHSILIQLMKDLILPLEKELGKPFPQEELELLSFYFGHQLSQSEAQHVPKKRAVVVCTNGLIVSKMMMESLKNLFPEFHFLASFSVREFETFASDYDLVFTTIPLATSLPQYIIEPLMNYKEQVGLRYRVLKETGTTELEQLLDELLIIIGKSSQIVETEQLKEDLEHFFITNKKDQSVADFHVLPALDKYVKPSYIQIIDEEINWEAAIRLATQPLLADKIIMEKYVTELVQQTKDPNNCSFLGTEMAIPHAGIEDGVLETGIALLVNKRPIAYPNGQQLHVIAPIAIADLTKHLRAINQLADLSNEQNVANLLKAPSANAIYQKIKELR